MEYAPVENALVILPLALMGVTFVVILALILILPPAILEHFEEMTQ
jgi:hypothetical protein